MSKKLVKINELKKNTNERKAIYDFPETLLLPNKPPAGIKSHKKGHYYAKKKKSCCHDNSLEPCKSLGSRYTILL